MNLDNYNIDNQEEEDNLYVFKEDEPSTEDSLEHGDSPAPEDSPGGLSPIRVLLKTMLTPVEGFKALKRAHFSNETFAGRCFYPLVALASISDATSLFYEANFTISDWVLKGISTFVTFFFGYFTALMASSFLLPAKVRPLFGQDIGKQFLMICFSMLSLFWIIIQLAPMLEPVLVFLPIWTIYIIYKGVRMLRVPEDNRNSATGLLCMLVLGSPILWNLLIDFLL